MAFSRGSSRPRECLLHCRQILYLWTMGESWLSHQGHLINLCEMNEWTWSLLSAVIYPLRLLLILSYSRTVLPACRKAWERVLSEASLATYSRPPSFSSGLSSPASCRNRAYPMLILVLFWSKEGLKNVKETGKQWNILKERRQCVPTNPRHFLPPLLFSLRCHCCLGPLSLLLEKFQDSPITNNSPNLRNWGREGKGFTVRWIAQWLHSFSSLKTQWGFLSRGLVSWAQPLALKGRAHFNFPPLFWQLKSKRINPLKPSLP